MSDPILNNPFSDIPIRNTKYLTMGKPNELVEIHSGIFQIKNANGIYKCNGRLYYK